MPFLWRPDRPNRDKAAGCAIPRHMHFLWQFLGDGADLPPRELDNYRRWHELNPDWKSTIQTPNSIDEIIPGQSTRSLYEKLKTPIQRCDLARPILLQQHGGIYTDLDVEPFRDMDWLYSLFPHANVLLIEEVTLTKASSIRRGKRFSIRQGNPELRLRVGNFWMASVAGHPFWDDVIALIEQRKQLPIQYDYDVIYTTGPDIISEVYHQVVEKYDDVVLVPRKTARRFFRHRTHGSWRMNDNRITTRAA